MDLGNIKKLSKNKIVAVVLFLITVFLSGHAFQTTLPILRNTIYLPAAIGLLFIVFDNSCTDLRQTQNAMLWVFILMVVSTAITDMVNNLMFYIQFLTMIITAYCIASIYSFKTISKCYLNVMTVVSIVALIGYILVNNTSVLDFLPTMKNNNDYEYKVGIIFNYIIGYEDRNCGMFWEPGLFATHLAIATVLELTIKEKASLLKLILFTACFFTANSAAGFVLWFLCVALLLVRKKGENRNYNFFKSVFSIVIILTVIAVFSNFDTILANTGLGENPYFQKLSTENIMDSSRSNAITHNMELFAKYPILGAGYTTVQENMAYFADNSTSTYLMSIFGILGVSYTAFMIYGVMHIKKINLFSRFIILLILIMIVNKEPHYMILITWIILFYLVKGFENDNPKETAQKDITGRNI